MCEFLETDHRVHTGIADSLKLTMADSQMHPYMHHRPVLSTLFYLKNKQQQTNSKKANRLRMTTSSFDVAWQAKNCYVPFCHSSMNCKPNPQVFSYYIH